MLFIVLGIILIVIAVLLSRNKEPQIQKLIPVVRIVGGIMFVGGILFSSVRQIEPGEVGVQTLFGKVQNRNLCAANVSNYW